MSDLRKLAEDLSDLDGPWGVSQSSLIGGYGAVICEQIVVAHCFREEVAAYIAAASPAEVLGLLDEVERLKADNLLLSEKLLQSLEVRGRGCQCGDDDACAFVQERDRYRDAVRRLVNTKDYDEWEATLADQVVREIMEGE